MTADRYFDQISQVMELDAPPAIEVKPLAQSIVQFARMTSMRDDHGVLPIPRDDAFLMTLQLLPLPDSNIWLSGRHHRKRAMKRGSFALVNLNAETDVEINMPFDTVQMVYPRSTLNAVIEENGGRDISNLSIEGVQNVNDDPVVRNLGHALLPAFERPEQASPLFIEHVSLAMLTHIAGTYGGVRPQQRARGGLASWQIRRATEILTADLKGSKTLEEIARECELSRSHFARAFKKSLGVAPHKWLMERRLDKASELLMKTKLPLAQIADEAGFADQSHFTRCFVGSTGFVPSEWRRLRTSHPSAW
jgi:AraC family transcriptional regulator